MFFLFYLDIKKILGQRINLDGLSSIYFLHLGLDSLEGLSIRNLSSLRHLELSFFNRFQIDSTIQSKVFNDLPNIEYLSLHADLLSNFNLDSLVSLKSLTLEGNLDKDFNFDLLKNLCHKLKKLTIKIYNLDNKSLDKLFCGHHFSILDVFTIRLPNDMTKLEKKLFNGFPMLQSLILNDSKHLREIDQDAFSNLGQFASFDLSNSNIESLGNHYFSSLIYLKYLNLSINRLKSIEANLFSNLTNLRGLDLSHNQLTTLDPKLFSSLKNLIWLSLDYNLLVQFDLCIMDYIKEIKKISALGNSIINKEEILERFNQSDIEFKI